MDRRSALLMGPGWMAATLPGLARSVPPVRKVAAHAPFVGRPDGALLYFQDWGDGEPVLLVHSAGVSSAIWAYQLPALLQSGHRCITYDRRGHGRSSVPAGGYDYDTLADDLAAIIEALDLKGLTLVGHSMGCGEIARYLVRHGAGRVRRIALLAPTLPFFLQTADNPTGLDRKFFQDLRQEWLRDYPGWAWRQTPAFFTPETSQAMQQWGFTIATQTPLHVLVATNIAVTETDFRPELTRIKVPTLILQGTKDRSCPLPITGQRVAGLIPDARLVVIEGAPHGLPITHAERVNLELGTFLVS